MKTPWNSASTICCGILAASLQVGLAVDPPKNPVIFGVASLDEVTLIGLTKEEAIKRLGQPESISGPEDGFQTYEYPSSRHLSVVFREGKLTQYIVRPEATAKTAKGIQIGSFLGAVTKEYGDLAREEEVSEWFGGSEERVLYHNPEYQKFKLIYPQADLIFIFNAEKAVEWMWVGFPTG